MRECRFERYRTGGGILTDNDGASHRALIARCIAEGWHYVGWVPLTFTGHGGIHEIDLIFERETDE